MRAVPAFALAGIFLAGVACAYPAPPRGVAACSDLDSCFATAAKPMVRRPGSVMDPDALPEPASMTFAPVDKLEPHAFGRGWDEIGIPAGWTVHVGRGGVNAIAPGEGASVAFDVSFSAHDPSTRAIGNVYPPASDVAVPYTADPVTAWISVYRELARQRDLDRTIRVRRLSRSSSGGDFAGTLGTGAKQVLFIAHAAVSPLHDDGTWFLVDSHVFVRKADYAREAATANAVVDSVRIDPEPDHAKGEPQ